MTDDVLQFEPIGDWWGMPVWRKALLMVTLRPYCKVKGYVAVARQWIALRAPNRPFRPFAWVHKAPCSSDIEYRDCRHDEYHPDPHDSCVTGYHGGAGPHFLEYERELDGPYSFADDFDRRVGRMYRFVGTP